MRDSLQDRIDTIGERAAEEKKDIRSNLSLNFDSDTDSMETYIEFEAMSHSIDQYNIERDSAQEKLGRVKRLLAAPYFARVTLQFAPEEEPEDYYIGSAGISENAWEHLVIDWRSPIAETYYNQDNGRTFYEVNGIKIDVDLLLRRQFNLEKDVLHSYFDTQVAIEDPLLLQSLASRRSDKMQAITATIQKEQNAVIRYDNVPVLLVNGIAGSGKTSVLLQRIAYLFYRQRENLRPEQVYLLTLNPVFRRYIDHVLPDLGEENPHTITWQDFIETVGVPMYADADGNKQVWRGYGYETTAENLHRIDAAISGGDAAGAAGSGAKAGSERLVLEREDFKPVYQKGFRVLSAGDIADVASEYLQIPTGPRLIQIMIDVLKDRARREVRRSESDFGRGKDEGDPESGIVSSGDGAEGARDLSESSKEERRITNQYGGAFHAIDVCAWLDFDRIGRRILNKDKLNATEWFYLRMALTGECDRNARYVMIDEVQDYTLAQLMILKRYFVNAKFMMLGDEFQAIRPGTVTFAQIRGLFGDDANVEGEGGRNVRTAIRTGVSNIRKDRQQFAELPLMTSYRSSPEITELFTGLLPSERKVLASSVQRPGMKPVVEVCGNRREYEEKLREAVGAAARADGSSQAPASGEAASSEQMSSGAGLTAVVCGSRRSLEKIQRILLGDEDMSDKAEGKMPENDTEIGAAANDHTLSPQAGSQIKVVHRDEALPTGGIALMTLDLAKGLEFDSVIIPDADDKMYPDEILSRHRLYTAISRATQKLTILAEGKMTPLLSAAEEK